jgi:antitoxin Phd
MKTYTFSEARQKLATLLIEAQQEGEVLIRRRDGGLYAITPVRERRSPLNVPAVRADVTTREIVAVVRESRRPRVFRTTAK